MIASLAGLMAVVFVFKISACCKAGREYTRQKCQKSHNLIHRHMQSPPFVRFPFGSYGIGGSQFLRRGRTAYHLGSTFPLFYHIPSVYANVSSESPFSMKQNRKIFNKKKIQNSVKNGFSRYIYKRKICVLWR